MQKSVLNKQWHMAENEYEVELTELEFSIMRVASAFDRWRADCMACCTDLGLSGADTSVLHVIRMHDRPKSISEIARLLNRDDQSNLQYGIRKLLNAGLIEKTGNNDSKKGVTYMVTALGREITNKASQIRRELLLSLTKSISTECSFADGTRMLNVMSAMYDQASCIAAAHRITPPK